MATGFGLVSTKRMRLATVGSKSAGLSEYKPFKTACEKLVVFVPFVVRNAILTGK